MEYTSFYQFQDNLNTNGEYRIRGIVYLENGNIEFSENEISIDVSTDSVANDTLSLTLNSYYKLNDPLFEIPDHFIYRFKDSNASRAYSHIMYNQGIYFQSTNNNKFLIKHSENVNTSTSPFSFYPHQYNTDLSHQFRPLLHNDYFILSTTNDQTEFSDDEKYLRIEKNVNGNRLIQNNEEVYIKDWRNLYLNRDGVFTQFRDTWKIMSDNNTSINFENNLSYTFEYYTVDTNDYYNISDTSINLTFEIDNTELEFMGVSYNDTTLYSFSSKQFLYVDNETINVDNLNVLVSKDMDKIEEISFSNDNGSITEMEINTATQINIYIKDKVGKEVNVDNYQLFSKSSSLSSLYTEYGNSEFTLTPQFEKNNNSKPIIYINHNYPDETIVYFLLNDRIYDNLMNKKSKYIYQFQDNLNTNDEYRIRAYVYLENGNIEFSNNEISIDINTDSVKNDTSTLTLNSHYKPNDPPLFEIPDHFIYRFKDSNALNDSSGELITAYSHIMYNQGIYLQRSSSSIPMYLSR